MKKILTLAIAALSLMACVKTPQNPATNLKVTVNDAVIANNQEIIITDYQQDVFTEKDVMEIRGTVSGVDVLSVNIVRASEGEDEFCAGIECTPGKGLSQDINVKMVDQKSMWYAHYYPQANGDYTVTYTFKSGEESVALKVIYRYEAKEDSMPGKDDPTPEVKSFPRKHLLEHFTGEACVYCPTGMDYISSYVAANPNTIWVSHHYGYGVDEYSISTNEVIGRKLNVQGAPGFALNRFRRTVVDPSDGSSETNVVLHPYYLMVCEMTDADEACASVEIDRTYDNASRQLTLTVHGKCLDLSKYNKFNLSVLIKENNLIGRQADAYNGTWTQYRHNKVVRTMLTADLGDEVACDAEGNYSQNFTFAVPAQWKENECCVVAYIASVKNEGTVLKPCYPIVNAEQVVLVEGTDGGEKFVCEGLKH